MGERRYSNLRDVRYMNGNITQAEMAEKIGMTLGAYSKIETRHAYGAVRTWRRIQDLFGLTDAEVWQLMARK